MGYPNRESQEDSQTQGYVVSGVLDALAAEHSPDTFIGTNKQSISHKVCDVMRGESSVSERHEGGPQPQHQHIFKSHSMSYRK